MLLNQSETELVIFIRSYITKRCACYCKAFMPKLGATQLVIQEKRGKLKPGRSIHMT